MIKAVHAALVAVDNLSVLELGVQAPAVPIRNSIKPEYLVCLEDGRKMKTLKRYLANRFGMSPAEYRTKWGLPHDYPMVAPAYSEQRRSLAISLGLGRKKADEAPAAAPEPAEAGVGEVAPDPEATSAAKRGHPRKLSLRLDGDDQEDIAPTAADADGQTTPDA